MRDLVPLTSRLAMLSMMRALLGAAAVGAWVAAPAADGRPAGLLAAAGAYALLAGGLELARRVLPAIPLSLLAGGLLADGVYLVAIVMLAGGPRGPLGFLLLVHLIAVTLLASYRTGLKLAMWHSLLLAAAAATPLKAIGGGTSSPVETAQVVATLWVVTMATAACAAYNERELRRSRAGSAAMAEMAERLQHISGPGDVAPVLLTAVQAYTGCRRAAVLFRVDDMTSGHALHGARATMLIRAPRPAGAAARCWQDRRPVLASELDPAADRALLQLLPDARNVVVIPMLDDDGPVGVLAVERAGGRGRSARIAASIVDLLSEFAAHAALAHRNALLLERIRRLAAADGLTGLANRRAFDDALVREIQRAHRTGQPLTLLILDIDHFKQVNDTHGHQVGDDVLRHVAAVLSELLRGSDLPARYGGEEFAVLMPDCHAIDAVAIAERVRAAVADSDSPVPVTVSVGVATLPGDAQDERGLIAAADAALYEAKEQGRDRVVRATAAA